MLNKIIVCSGILLLLFVSVNFISCSKPDLTPADPCLGKTIIINGSVISTSGGTSTDGSLAATATGSSGFSYSINNGPFQPTGNFSNLAAATYIITAKDGNGCTANRSFIIPAAACPIITITATSTPASSSTAVNGAITATAAGSTGLTYSINNISFQSTGSFTGLGTGSYTVTVKDVNGCTGSAVFIVASATCPAITVTAVTTLTSGPTANNGSLTATATGGATPYTYSKDGGVTFQASGSFNNLTAGNYTIVAKDVNGCLGSSGTITVSSAPCPSITLSAGIIPSDKCTNNNGALTVTAGGSSGFTYNINGGTFQSSNFFFALGTGNYTLGVKDVNGCVKTGTAMVNIAPAGPTFAIVKSIITTNCAFSGCHAGAAPQNGIDFNDDCTIVAQRVRIKARAVDGIPSIMPPSGAISASDKQKILDWINAGGQHSN
ncbi:MAG: hypothetical protein WKF88_03155 [Ferruginibacter sp.]